MGKIKRIAARISATAAAAGIATVMAGSPPAAALGSMSAHLQMSQTPTTVTLNLTAYIPATAQEAGTLFASDSTRIGFLCFVQQFGADRFFYGTSYTRSHPDYPLFYDGQGIYVDALVESAKGARFDVKDGVDEIYCKAYFYNAVGEIVRGPIVTETVKGYF